VPAYRLEELAWPAMAALTREQAIGLIPTGAVEQHGPHLPLDTDRLIARELGHRVGEALSDAVIVAPVAPFGLSDHHMAFPGTATVAAETFTATLDAYVKMFARAGVNRVGILTAHGGNFEHLAAYETARRHLAPVVAAHHDRAGFFAAMRAGAHGAGLHVVEADVHAGTLETSMALALFPQLVGDPRHVEGYVAAEAGWLDALHDHGAQHLAASGVLGAPQNASAAAGEHILRALTKLLCHWAQGALGARPAVGG